MKYEKNWPDWHELFNTSITSAEELSEHYLFDHKDMQNIIDKFPMRINLYYLSLIKTYGDPIWKQAVPDSMEIKDYLNAEDPLCEEIQSPVKNLIHRYPDRVLFSVSSQCAMLCRFCMRKRKMGTNFIVDDHTIKEGLYYIRSNKCVRDVIISGGDPFLLENDVLNEIMNKLRLIPHVEIIRIHTRVPCTLPQRITKHLASILKKYHPVFINTHFNHYDEITPEAEKACGTLVDAGIPVGCQTVLLKGVNDSPFVMSRLMQNLQKIRVTPYYIHHADAVKGTAHFRTSIYKGIEILKELYRYVPDCIVPHYMIDLPGGGGKIPIGLEYNKNIIKKNLTIKNFQGNFFQYPDQ